MSREDKLVKAINRLAEAIEKQQCQDYSPAYITTSGMVTNGRANASGTYQWTEASDAEITPT